MSKACREYRETYVVKVLLHGRKWEYYAGVDIYDTVHTTPVFRDSFRFHDRWTAERVADTIIKMGREAYVKEVL